MTRLARQSPQSPLKHNLSPILSDKFHFLVPCYLSRGLHSNTCISWIIRNNLPPCPDSESIEPSLVSAETETSKKHDNTNNCDDADNGDILCEHSLVLWISEIIFRNTYCKQIISSVLIVVWWLGKGRWVKTIPAYREYRTLGKNIAYNSHDNLRRPHPHYYYHVDVFVLLKSA